MRKTERVTSVEGVVGGGGGGVGGVERVVVEEDQGCPEVMNQANLPHHTHQGEGVRVCVWGGGGGGSFHGDTCDDDLGNIQNGAVRRGLTVTSLILGTCCGDMHTHTYIQSWDHVACRPGHTDRQPDRQNIDRRPDGQTRHTKTDGRT